MQEKQKGKTYLIGYDLMRPGQNYQALFAAIEALGPHWHPLDSTWIVRSSLSAVGIRDRLIAHMDANDKLLVAHMAGEAAWWNLGSEAANQWLKNALVAA